MIVEQLHKLANNDPNIIFTGHVEGEQLQELYSNAYLFVSPMKVKGLPLTVLEARSFGRCVVSSDIDQTQKAYDYTIRFQNGNAADLSLVIEDLLGNKLKVAQPGRESRRYIHRNHSWKEVAERFEKIYNELAGR